MIEMNTANRQLRFAEFASLALFSYLDLIDPQWNRLKSGRLELLPHPFDETNINFGKILTCPRSEMDRTSSTATNQSYAPSWTPLRQATVFVSFSKNKINKRITSSCSLLQQSTYSRRGVCPWTFSDANSGVATLGIETHIRYRVKPSVMTR